MEEKNIQERSFLLAGYGETTTQGVAQVVTFDRRQRLARAGKGLGVLWGAGLVSVFIPVAHFLLVPGFALAGVVVFARRMRVAEVTHSIHGRCPDCGLEQDFGSAGRWKPPVTVACRGCSRRLTAR